jgi:hypothetical protein
MDGCCRDRGALHVVGCEVGWMHDPRMDDGSYGNGCTGRGRHPVEETKDILILCESSISLLGLALSNGLFLVVL